MNDPCYTCRRRRIQCDQTATPCAKCEKSGFECFQERPLRWVKGVTLRTKFHDSVLRRSIHTKRMPAKLPEGRGVDVATEDSPSSNPASLSHHDNFSSGAADQKTVEDTDTTLVVASPRNWSNQAISHLDKTSRYYLDYCKCHFSLYIASRHPRRTRLKY